VGKLGQAVTATFSLYIHRSLALAGLLALCATSAFAANAVAPTAIGHQRELFVDDVLIDQLSGGAERRLHHPEPHEIALVHDAPWEGGGTGYHSVFQDGDRYRMFYKAGQMLVSPKGVNTEAHPLYCCYAESEDGIHWRKPELGLNEFNGSTANNIVIASGPMGDMKIDAGACAFFKDDNPVATHDARYKALIHANSPKGLVAFQSSDCLHWSPIQTEPVLTAGAFDSQNLAFWDSVHDEYRAYWRIFSGGVPKEKNWVPGGMRAIRTAASKDFIHWTKQAEVTFADSPREHLYTSQVKPYYRAPQLLLGFPTRYLERGWSESMRALPEREHREMRSAANQRYGTAITEALLMASRDGVHFQRWNEAFLRPGIERDGTWNYGQQYIGWQVVETKSAIEGAPHELSLYATERYWNSNGSALRRYTLRLDGFVSVNAPLKGGELLTKPLTFTGSKLTLNFSTSAAGSVRVELQDADGNALPGYTFDDCEDTFGDALDRPVVWKGGTDVNGFAGKPVRLRFVLKDADLFAFRFE
jgi:hypothetical protein